MKYVKGWYLPDTDTHFENYIENGGYQTIHRETILKYIKMRKPELKNCIDFVTTCPEVEIGMGTPRKPIRIVEEKNQLLLIQRDSGIDYSSKMNDFSRTYLSDINTIDGFILKANSPSCGINNAKKYLKGNPAPIGKTSGLFASEVIIRYSVCVGVAEAIKTASVFSSFTASIGDFAILASLSLAT